KPWLERRRRAGCAASCRRRARARLDFRGRRLREALHADLELARRPRERPPLAVGEQRQERALGDQGEDADELPVVLVEAREPDRAAEDEAGKRGGADDRAEPPGEAAADGPEPDRDERGGDAGEDEEHA